MAERNPASVLRPTDIDQALIRRSHQGDSEAFRELFERKHRRVYLIAYQVLGDQIIILRALHGAQQWPESFEEQ